eukprot:1182512-Prorocentrum_minimum.AAC.1
MALHDELARKLPQPWAGFISRVGGVADRMNQMRSEVLGNVSRILMFNRPLNNVQILSDLYPSSLSAQRSGGYSYQLQTRKTSRRNPRTPCFASVSASVSGPQPVYTLALSRNQMTTAVEGVPVWTVTNEDNEFILMSQQAQDNAKQLGLFCLSEENAKLLLKEVNAGGVGKAKIVPVTLDK